MQRADPRASVTRHDENNVHDRPHEAGHPARFGSLFQTVIVPSAKQCIKEEEHRHKILSPRHPLGRDRGAGGEQDYQQEQQETCFSHG